MSLLLQLPQEVLLEILDIIYEEYSIVGPDGDPEKPDIFVLSEELAESCRGNPLGALRLCECVSILLITLVSDDRTGLVNSSPICALQSSFNLWT
jgi:hypothetical protein